MAVLTEDRAFFMCESRRDAILRVGESDAGVQAFMNRFMRAERSATKSSWSSSIFYSIERASSSSMRSMRAW